MIAVELLHGDGCRHCLHCEECPFPDCIAEDKDLTKKYRGLPEAERIARNNLLVQDLDMGMTVRECMTKYELSKTHVERIRNGGKR